MKRLLSFALLVVLFSSCSNQEEKKEAATVTDSLTRPVPKADQLSQQDSIKATGRQVLMCLKNNDYPELIKYFSDKGVVFVPYGFIDTLHSKKLNATAFTESVQKNWVLSWGQYDGTGKPIQLTVPAYLKKFVYNADYLNAEAVGFDEIMKQGNTINNLKSIYPNHHFIDYHFSGFEQKYKGMDWTSLKLVFEQENGEYFLVALIHDQWTI